MSVARHHAEWLSLVEVSGPFVSMPVLLRIFPQGLDELEAAARREFREAYDDWLERGGTKVAAHRGWVMHVLTELLGYPAKLLAEGQTLPPGLEATMAQFGEVLRPDYALLGKKDESGESRAKPQLLVSIYPKNQDLAKPVTGKVWKASPGTRMMELLHATDIPLGLVTNGEQWMLVYAPRGETTGFASWYADIWPQEPITLRAFVSLLHLRRFQGVAAGDTLAAVLQESAKDQHDVTDQLGYQVRQAVEVLVQALDRLDMASEKTLLAGVDEKALYDAALTVMMRLVFMFAAEEKHVIPPSDYKMYEEFYSLAALRDELRERADQQGEIVLEHRHDAWCRLLATFRAVHGGVEHESMRLPAYGGTLFDPDRFPFLEGRAAGTTWTETPAKPLGINNRVVLHLLEALQILQVKVPGGGPAEARRLSFRALDIEQIGHVYEGLLDHTAKRAGEVVLGLAGAKGKEPEIPLSKLEAVAGINGLKVLETPVDEQPLRLVAEKPGEAPRGKPQGPTLYNHPQEALVEFLVDETGRSASAITKAWQRWDKVDAHTLSVACGHDMHLEHRIRPFAGLLRTDSFGHLVVIPEGSVYVTSGSDRRSTGTHYTPRSLTEPIVEHTLEPLVYVGPAEGKPEKDWQLKSPKEILELKVCDLAMGSGAFLVQACRYLSERLVEAWEHVEQANPGKFLKTPDGQVSDGDPRERLLPLDPGERLAIARRYVADRCLYGVDINPMAVEMAKLSLWLITLQKDRPFTFIDHALKCGDSLLGVSTVKQIENFSLRPGDRQVTFATANLFRYVEEASKKRRALEDLPSNDHTQIETKSRLHAEAEAATAKVKVLADCLIAFELRGLDGDAYEDHRTIEAEKLQLLMQRDADASLKVHPATINQLSANAREQLNGRRPFHWEVEFPEVFARGGFAAFVGNPPFLGGKRICNVMGDDYNAFLKLAFVRSKGAADLCAYFYRRVEAFLSSHAAAGLLATNTIAQGDTREVGLDHLTQHGCVLVNVISNMPWPGVAGVTVSVIIYFKGTWSGALELDGAKVEFISPHLEAARHSGTPHQLSVPVEKASYGTGILGIGFTLPMEQARQWIKDDSRYADILFPYINAEDLNTSPTASHSRFVINFGERSEDEAASYPLAYQRVKELVKPQRDRLTRQIHETCWWRHWDKRTELYAEAARFNEVLVVPLVTKHLSFAFLPFGWIYSKELGVLPTDRRDLFAIYQSTFHELWVRRNSSTLETRLAYSFSDALRTYAVPFRLLHNRDKALSELGCAYEQVRNEACSNFSEGLTKTYNRFHDRSEKSPNIVNLRAFHVEMDQAVAAAYGWSDLDLGHAFHATKQGERYTLSESARRIVLDRLLALNHERYAEEVKAGLHDKKAKGGRMKAEGKPAAKRDAQQSLDFEVPGAAKRATPGTRSGATVRRAMSDADKPQAEEAEKETRNPEPDDVDTIMGVIRKVAKSVGETSEEGLITGLAREYGYQRVSPTFRTSMQPHIQTALRRRILGKRGELLICKTRGFKDYAELDADAPHEFLAECIVSVMRKGSTIDQYALLERVARHLGFSKVTVDMRMLFFQPVLTLASRRGIVQRKGHEVTRL